MVYLKITWTSILKKKERKKIEWDFSSVLHFLSEGARIMNNIWSKRKGKSLSCVQLFATPWVVNARLLCLWNSPRKNTGVGCHSLLQRIFLAQGLNPSLLHWRQILYCLSHQGNPISSQVLTYQSDKGKDSCGFTITTVHSPLAQSS